MSGIVGNNTGRGSGIIKAAVVGADAITGDEIADDAVDSEHYTDGSIDNAHIADNAIDSEHYADGSIDNAHIADDAIDSEHYAAGSIDEAHIADNAVTLAKMAGGTDGQIITFDADGDPVAVGPGSDGEVLTSTGSGSPPAFEAAGGADATYVQFPATQVASADANRLDDYEEGTWTPALKHSSGSGTPDTTYNGQTGHYVKVGQTCWIFLQIKINSLGTGHTSAFQGAPFTSFNIPTGSNSGGHSYYNSALAVSPIALGCDIASNDTGFTVRGRTAAAVAISSQAIFGDSARFDCTFVYRTAA